MISASIFLLSLLLLAIAAAGTVLAQSEILAGTYCANDVDFSSGSDLRLEVKLANQVHVSYHRVGHRFSTFFQCSADNLTARALDQCWPSASARSLLRLPFVFTTSTSAKTVTLTDSDGVKLLLSSSLCSSMKHVHEICPAASIAAPKEARTGGNSFFERAPMTIFKPAPSDADADDIFSADIVESEECFPIERLFRPEAAKRLFLLNSSNRNDDNTLPPCYTGASCFTTASNWSQFAPLLSDVATCYLSFGLSPALMQLPSSLRHLFEAPTFSIGDLGGETGSSAASREEFATLVKFIRGFNRTAAAGDAPPIRVKFRCATAVGRGRLVTCAGNNGTTASIELPIRGLDLKCTGPCASLIGLNRPIPALLVVAVGSILNLALILFSNKILFPLLYKKYLIIKMAVQARFSGETKEDLEKADMDHVQRERLQAAIEARKQNLKWELAKRFGTEFADEEKLVDLHEKFTTAVHKADKLLHPANPVSFIFPKRDALPSEVEQRRLQVAEQQVQQQQQQQQQQEGSTPAAAAAATGAAANRPKSPLRRSAAGVGDNDDDTMEQNLLPKHEKQQQQQQQQQQQKQKEHSVSFSRYDSVSATPMATSASRNTSSRLKRRRSSAALGIEEAVDLTLRQRVRALFISVLRERIFQDYRRPPDQGNKKLPRAAVVKFVRLYRLCFAEVKAEMLGKKLRTGGDLSASPTPKAAAEAAEGEEDVMSVQQHNTASSCFISWHTKSHVADDDADEAVLSPSEKDDAGKGTDEKEDEGEEEEEEDMHDSSLGATKTMVLETAGKGEEEETFESRVEEIVAGINVRHDIEWVPIAKKHLFLAQRLLRPPSWLMNGQLLYVVIYAVMCVADAGEEISASPYWRGRRSFWQLYQIIFFQFFSSSVPSALVVNRGFYLWFLLQSENSNPSDGETSGLRWRDIILRFVRDPFIATPVVLAMPALFSHVLPAVVVFVPIFVVLAALILFYVFCVRQCLPKVSWGEGGTGTTPQIPPSLFWGVTLGRALCLMVASVSLRTAFAYAMIFMYGDDHKSWADTIVDVWNAGSIECGWLRKIGGFEANANTAASWGSLFD